MGRPSPLCPATAPAPPAQCNPLRGGALRRQRIGVANWGSTLWRRAYRVVHGTYRVMRPLIDRRAAVWLADTLWGRRGTLRWMTGIVPEAVFVLISLLFVHTPWKAALLAACMLWFLNWCFWLQCSMWLEIINGQTQVFGVEKVLTRFKDYKSNPE